MISLFTQIKKRSLKTVWYYLPKQNLCPVNTLLNIYLLNWSAHSCIPKIQTRMLIAVLFPIAPKLKTTQMLISDRMWFISMQRDKLWLIHTVQYYTVVKTMNHDYTQQHGEISHTWHWVSKARHQRVILYDSICTKFKNRQNSSTVLDTELVVILGGQWQEAGKRLQGRWQCCRAQSGLHRWVQWVKIHWVVHLWCVYLLCMCYISVKSLHKVLIDKARNDNATPSPQSPFLAEPQLCSLHSYDNFLFTVQHNIVGCSSLEDFALTAPSVPRYPHSPLPHLIQVSAWTSYRRNLPCEIYVK